MYHLFPWKTCREFCNLLSTVFQRHTVIVRQQGHWPFSPSDSHCQQASIAINPIFQQFACGPFLNAVIDSVSITVSGNVFQVLTMLCVKKVSSDPHSISYPSPQIYVFNVLSTLFLHMVLFPPSHHFLAKECS